MSSVIITVVVVLGIIVAGGFLLYFMGDLFMSLSHKKKDEKTIANRQAEQNKSLEERINALEKAEEIKKDPEIATILYNGAVVEDYNPNEEENGEEQEDEVEEQLEQPEEQEETEETEEQVENDEAQEESAEKQEDDEEIDDTTEFIRQRRMELMERLARMQAQEEQDESEETEEDESVDLTEENEEQKETESAEETTSEEVELHEDEEETKDESAEESQEPVTDDADQVSVYEENKSDVNALASNMTLEELESKLAEEQDKLKANEKELRQCKKEFIPLRRVKRTLESDEKKLRRKEALVAKQKVVLYGVNNYADIDEEKAKKLEEDLDLLEGLKLSVQHCEEVMEKNAERYPLLEKIFNLLSSQNTEIKEDIKNLQEAIDSLKADDTADDDSTADVE